MVYINKRGWCAGCETQVVISKVLKEKGMKSFTFASENQVRYLGILRSSGEVIIYESIVH